MTTSSTIDHVYKTGITTRADLISDIVNDVAEYEQLIAAYAARVTKDPINAFSGAAPTIEAAANRDLLLAVKDLLEKGLPVQTICENLKWTASHAIRDGLTANSTNAHRNLVEKIVGEVWFRATDVNADGSPRLSTILRRLSKITD